MARKQVDFAFRVLEYAPLEAGKSSADNSKYLKDNYLDLGWEILKTEVTQVAANSIFVAVSLLKYEDVPEVTGKRASS